MCVSAQSCPTLHDPMDCSLPGSSVHGVFQARVLEWVAIYFHMMIINYLAIQLYPFPFVKIVGVFFWLGLNVSFSLKVDIFLLVVLHLKKND